MTDFERLCDEYRENKRMIEELDAEQDALKDQILAIMDGQDSYTAGAAKATYKEVKSQRFDSAGFKRVYPDLYSKYSRESVYKRFTVV